MGLLFFVLLFLFTFLYLIVFIIFIADSVRHLMKLKKSRNSNKMFQGTAIYHVCTNILQPLNGDMILLSEPFSEFSFNKKIN